MDAAAPRRRGAPAGAGIAAALAVAVQDGGEPPALRETHMSWVVLTGDRAYKLKKPVRFGFVDFSTPELRRQACEEEVRVNQDLAASVVLGVRALVPAAGGLRLAPASAEEAIDWVVEMRRFDEDRTMAALLAAGTLTPGQVDATGRVLAGFHARAARCLPAQVATVSELAERNLAELEPLCTGVVPADVLRDARRFAAAVARARGADLADRIDRGLARDGHGDLRAEHVLLEGPDVVVVDRLEFDPALRAVDVGDDLAFLVMDLEHRDGAWAAGRLVAAYRAAGGDPGDDALMAFFAVYRAQVRAKVELLRAGQLPPAQAERARLRGRALLALGERLAWRARGRLLLAVTGPPASGKSTLARALGRASGLPVLGSDVTRKAGLGVPAGTQAPASAYTAAARASVYRQLARHAEAALARGGAIVDATFGDAAAQEAFLDALEPESASMLRVVELRAPAAVLAERARRRQELAGDPSDAGPQVAARLARTFMSLPAARGHRLVADAELDTEDIARAVTAWLDEHLAGTEGASGT